MIGHYPRNEDFVPGYRFLTAGWGPPLFEPFGMSTKRVGLLMEVVRRDGMEFVTRDQNGSEHECRLRHHDRPEIGKDLRRMGLEIVWGDPLPNGPLNEMAAFTDVLLHSGYRNPAVLLLCDDIDETGRAACTLVHTAKRGGETDWRMDDVPLAGETIGGAWFSEETIHVAPGAMKTHPYALRNPGGGEIADRNGGPGPQWNAQAYTPSPGDLFVATSFRTSHDEPVTIVRAKFVRIAGNMGREAVGAWLPIPEREGHYRTDLPLGSRMDIENEIGRAIARREPDEVVVISVPVIDPEHEGEVDVRSLSRSGIKLHESDNLDDDLYATDLEPGVWIGEDVTWHDCGEDGAEWSADWRRATREDLERHGLSFDEIAENWQEYSDLETSAAQIEAMLDSDVETERLKTEAEASALTSPSDA